MLAYYKELNDCKSNEEKAKVKDKYTFFGEIKALPQNTQIKHIIAMLEDIYANIKIKYMGNNPEDCHYLVTIENQGYKIKNISELKAFLFNSYSISNLASKEE